MTYISPQFSNWLKTKMPISPRLRNEFFDRLDNLCELTDPMSPDLHSEIINLFGLSVTKVIEGYATAELPVFNPGDVKVINYVIPKQFSLEFQRLFTRVCATVPTNLFWAELPANSTILIDGAFAGVDTFTDSGCAASIQGLFGTNYAGAAWRGLGITLYIWILADAEPTTWTADGNPVTFIDDGAAALRCFETATFPLNFGEPSANWYMALVDVNANPCELNNIDAYDSVAFAAFLSSLVPQLYGGGATHTLTVDALTVYIKISNTYTVPTDIVSKRIADNTPQANVFNATSC